MKLEAEGHDPVSIEEEGEIDGWLDRLAYDRPPGFLSLVAPSGDYLQIAGSGLRVTVEHRVHDPDGSFRHFVLGEEPADDRLISINTRAGIIRLHRHEVLSVAKAKRIFRAFFEGESLEARWTRRDDTARFIKP